MTSGLDEREALMKFLLDRGIQTRPIWALIHSLKPYRDERAYQIERAEYYYERVLNLPCSTNLTTEQVKEVAAAIGDFYGTKL